MKKWFAKLGLATLWAFIWELLEELLEEVIAYGLTSFIVKTLSTAIVVLATIGIKRLMFRALKPLVKKLTYKKGDDKMSKIKKFFSWIWSNKKSLTGVASSAVIALSGTGVIDVSTLPELPINGFNVTPILYYGVLLVLALIGVFGKGFESIKTYVERIAKEKAEKEEQAIIKEAKAELKAEQKLANQTQAQQEKATAKEEAKKLADAEKQKAEAEHRAKVEKAKTNIKVEEAKAKQAELTK